MVTWLMLVWHGLCTGPRTISGLRPNIEMAGQAKTPDGKRIQNVQNVKGRKFTYVKNDTIYA